MKYKKLNPKKRFQYKIYSKETTIWLLGLLSADGYITESKVVACVTVEKEWAENIASVLRKNQIKCSLLTIPIPPTSFSHRKTWYQVRILKRNPRYLHSGINQLLSLINSIHYWKLEDFIIKRKLEKLEGIIKNDISKYGLDSSQILL